ncbi:hypothetical protein N7494_001339 [Penicillium frequentans]|uniref:Major facilitator superfamily (MFS) profile domain-containing protein n=1 Tax=Penicillium frequentans TaxID=3151616 RepID=A0AAD6D7J0_9EURO|nr:hypothetical protein N7494_001339 [Penicillium glabrum]
MRTSMKRMPFKNFLICLAIAFGNTTYGYHAAIIGTTLSQPTFLAYFGLEDSPNAEALIGAMNGSFQAGSLFGVITTGMILTRYGCKMAIFYAATCCTIGGAIVTASQNVGMFIAFRFVAGIGSGLLQVCPVFTAELSPPNFRGFFVGMNGLMIALGFGLASWVGLAFNSLVSDSEAQWRGPLGIGINQEAWTTLRAIHDSDSDEQLHRFALQEYNQIRKQVELDRTLDSSWKHMFRKPSYRRRCLLVMAYAFLGESTAMLVITNYGSILYKQLGYDSHNQIVMQAAYQVVPFVGNLVGSLIVDRMGRRTLMLASLVGCNFFVAMEAAMVALYADSGSNEAGLRMGVAALFCFIFCYAIGVDVAGIVFYGEIFPNHIRAKGLTLAVGTRTLTDLVYLEAATTAFANIGWRFFLVFNSILTVGTVVMYFVLPETSGLPLEEVAAIFGDKDEVRSYMDQMNDEDNSDTPRELHGTDTGESKDELKPVKGPKFLHLEYVGA